MNRRVLHVLEATEGGTRTHLRDLVLRLRRDGWEVDVAVSTLRDPSFCDDLERFRDAGIGVCLVPMVRNPYPRADWRAFWALRRAIRATRPDLVHTHSSKAGFLGRAAARAEGKPSLYTPNAFRFQAPDAGRFERWLVTALERRAARWSDGIICVSDGERQAALDARIDVPERLHVVYNGIDLAPLDEAATLGFLEHELRFDEHLDVLLDRPRLVVRGQCDASGVEDEEGADLRLGDVHPVNHRNGGTVVRAQFGHRVAEVLGRRGCGT